MLNVQTSPWRHRQGGRLIEDEFGAIAFKPDRSKAVTQARKFNRDPFRTRQQFAPAAQ